MRIVFMGTPDFALPSLKALIDSHEVVAIYTQPDKPVGRKQILTPPCVKVMGEEYNIPVLQPNTLKDDSIIEGLKELDPEVIVVAAYGKLLPKAVLDIPKYGCINVHASLLPKYRGAAPIQWSVINGDKETGVTIMQMAEGLDTGDILTQEQIEIGIDDTAEVMFDKLSILGAELLIKTIDKLDKGEITPVKQDDSKASHVSMLDKSISNIDFSKTSFEVHKLVCGLYSWPIAQTTYEGKRLKIYKSRLSDLEGTPSSILSVEPLVIACGDKSIEILELQLEGSKRMDAHSFTLGHKLNLGDKLGE